MSENKVLDPKETREEFLAMWAREGFEEGSQSGFVVGIMMGIFVGVLIGILIGAPGAALGLIG